MLPICYTEATMEQLWYQLKREEVLSRLKTSKDGLMDEEVGRRRLAHGWNTLPPERPVSTVRLVLRQFQSSLVAILLGAAAISFALQDILDGNVILAAVLLNVVVGFFQERRAQKTLERLRSVVHFQALVVREGEERLIPADELVPGDVIVLPTGGRIPADARLLKAIDLSVNEAALTGESYPVPKQTKALEKSVGLGDQSNMVFLGTSATEGRGLAVVTATGIRTEIGKIAALLRATKEKPTPLQEHLHGFSRTLGTVILLIALGLFVLGLSVGQPLTRIFTVSVAVSVAAIPEGLLVAVTVILALGMQRILRRRALVRQLVAAETLGSTTVICTDKTGTLTEGVMSVVRIVTEKDSHEFGSETREHFEQASTKATTKTALMVGLLCNDAHVEHEDEPLEHRLVTGNPTERALVYAAHAVGLTRRELERQFPRLDTLPFTSERKHMLTIHGKAEGDHLLLLKGAPEIVVPMCTSFDEEGEHHRLTDSRRQELVRSSERMSREGLRVIAIAHRHVSRDYRELVSVPNPTDDYIFVALIGMKDPLRPGAAETVRICREAGIRTVMITGDHKLTAQAIAAELGLPSKSENIIDAQELAQLSEYDLEKRIREISVYARVAPKDKLRIIDAWQAQGHVVAMTGDGVNDAPALKSADIGVALGSGTDVAKETADLVLLDDNFRTIVDAVEQGRVIYENIRKVVLYLLTDSFSEVVLIAVSLITSLLIPGFPLPLLAAQILWINLVTDGLPNIALTVEPEERELMQEPPRNPKQALLSSEMRWLIGVVSVVSAGAAFAAFFFLWRSSGDLALAQTVAFAALGIDSLLYVFSIRSLRRSLFRTNLLGNPWLLAASAGGFIIQCFAIYFEPLQGVLGTVGLGLREWLVVAGAVLVVEAAVEIVKSVFRWKHHQTNAARS